MNYHVIANPVAGKKKALKNLKIVESVFKNHGAPLEIHFSKTEKDATNICRQLTEQGEKQIIALGGDGTLHEVLNGIANPSECLLGCIPSGTGNDFAERIGLPLDPKKATQLILETEAKPTDYLNVGGVRCMNVAGLGIDVDVLERCRRGRSKGKLKYVKSLLQSLFSFKGYSVHLKSDDLDETRDVLIAAACNGGLFGGGIQICPAADVADGLIDAIVVDCIGGKWKIVQAFIELIKGRILQYPLAKHFRCKELTFTPKNACTVQLDGELYKDLEFKVKLEQGLKFYRP